jgi:hypothetical protein
LRTPVLVIVPAIDPVPLLVWITGRSGAMSEAGTGSRAVWEAERRQEAHSTTGVRIGDLD